MTEREKRDRRKAQNYIAELEQRLAEMTVRLADRESALACARKTMDERLELWREAAHARAPQPPFGMLLPISSAVN
jgi:hypothetical protein